MTRYRLNWDNGGNACGTFPQTFDTFDAADAFGKAWADESNARDGLTDDDGYSYDVVTETEPEPRIYRILRFRENGRTTTVRNNVTLTEAQQHCSRDDTHGTRGGRRWFDGYDYMRGCRPREA